MKSIGNLLRIVISILVCIAFVGVIPIYDQPFDGCKTYGFVTLELGCTLWLDVLVGLGIVFFFILIVPRHLKPHLLGGTIVIILAGLGGLPAIKSVVYLDVLSHPDYMIFYWQRSGLATVLGGLLGIWLYYILLKLSKSKDKG
ncbi:MAG: hypothetical protein ACPHLK_05570 [Gammaproteobacteria bacterium]|jgi:hypothetical protein